MRIQGHGKVMLSFWILRAAALIVPVYLNESGKCRFFQELEIASSFSILGICVLVVIYYQCSKVILDDLEKCSI